MPFNFLLCECLHPGETGFKESGIGARIRPEGRECVLVFGIDNQRFRTQFSVHRACDALFFYKSQAHGPVLLFVELKGSDVESAAEQLGQALDAVRKGLSGVSEYRAIVVLRKSAPASRNKLWSRFRNKYGVELKVCRDGNLRPFL